MSQISQKTLVSSTSVFPAQVFSREMDTFLEETRILKNICEQFASVPVINHCEHLLW